MSANVPLKNGKASTQTVHKRPIHYAPCEVIQEETGITYTILFDERNRRCAPRHVVEEIILALQRGLDSISDDERAAFEISESMRGNIEQLPAMPEAIPQRQPGTLYLIVTRVGCKIGISQSIKKRIKTHLNTLPISPEAIYTCKIYDMAMHEELLHQHFYRKRTKGEWFDLDNDDIKQIVREYGMQRYEWGKSHE